MAFWVIAADIIAWSCRMSPAAAPFLKRARIGAVCLHQCGAQPRPGWRVGWRNGIDLHDAPGSGPQPTPPTVKFDGENRYLLDVLRRTITKPDAASSAARVKSHDADRAGA